MFVGLALLVAYTLIPYTIKCPRYGGLWEFPVFNISIDKPIPQTKSIWAVTSTPPSWEVDAGGRCRVARVIPRVERSPELSVLPLLPTT